MPRFPLLVIALFFVAGSIAHVIALDFFVAAMPDYLPQHRELVLISGVFELLGAIGILVPRTRLVAAYGLIALCLAVFPANIHMALHPERYPDIPELALYVRLPFQALFIGFIWWAVWPERQKTRIGAGFQPHRP